MRNRTRWARSGLALAVAVPLALAPAAGGQTPPPTPELEDPGLEVNIAATGLDQPISIAFLGRDDILVLEKASGQVKRVVDGQVRGVVLDLAVNSASERGLLGIALHPKFRRNGWVYLFWSESSTGEDTAELADVRLMGNRIDRFEWDGRQLEFDRHILTFRSLQDDATNGVLRGNHDGGVLRFGPEGTL
jgi:aldose sugar dehydrogenase